MQILIYSKTERTTSSQIWIAQVTKPPLFRCGKSLFLSTNVLPNYNSSQISPTRGILAPDAPYVRCTRASSFYEICQKSFYKCRPGQ